MGLLLHGFFNIKVPVLFSICGWESPEVEGGLFAWIHSVLQRDLSICGVWYLRRVLEPVPVDTEGQPSPGVSSVPGGFQLRRESAALTTVLSKGQL